MANHASKLGTKLHSIASIAVALILSVTLCLGIAFGLTACKGEEETNKPTVIEPTHVATEPILTYSYEYKSETQVGYTGSILGTVDRVKPVEEIRNEGLPAYPTYGYTLRDVIGTGAEQVAARDALIYESGYLAAYGTANTNTGAVTEDKYTWMDKDGYLFRGTVSDPIEAIGSDGQQRQLYQHTASVGLYFGNVADDEPGIVKQVTIRPRGYSSYSVTGVYAPAGEVIKIEISDEDMQATGGLTFHIGQALYNGQANNIWTAKNQMQRIPHLLNTMTINKNTASYNEETGMWTGYIGSFIGGPVYIRNTTKTYTATISGGVTYSHFILGYTTPEEYAENAKSTAPYFDLEVWEYGVLHSGPKIYSTAFSYDDIYKAAILWEKVSLVTTTGSNQGIVFLYDPFVAAGAAVAFPGRSSVNCPASWMANSLNYNSIVTSGAWGNFHEYHHNFQGYGVGNGGEVTNNGLTLVSYSLFTKISSARGIENYGASGTSGWNRYTTPTWPLEQVLKIARSNESPENGNQGLALYATLLHNFGPDNYMKAKVAGGGQSYLAYMNAWQKVTHNNMYYYFNDILKGTGLTNNADPSYPMFVPVSCVYQTGRSYIYDGEKKYFTSAQPYVIPYGEDFTIDLRPYSAPGGQYASGSIILPGYEKGDDGDFEYRIKSVTSPEHGTITQNDDYIFTFTPDSTLRSGQIIVTLEITKKDGAFEVDDIDLVLEFEQSHETNKLTLEKTTYTFAEGTKYTDAEIAYESGYAGYASKVTEDHTNPTQNCNTDIWLYTNTDAMHAAHPNSPESHFAHNTDIMELSGKLYFDDAGKYRIYMRGRNNCAVYYSVDDGETYQLGGTIKDTTIASNSAAFRVNDSDTYFDVDMGERSWLYFKLVLIVENLNTQQASYVGLGTLQWTEPIFTMVEKYYDSYGNEITQEQAEELGISGTIKYYNYQGVEVSEEEATNAELMPPTGTPAYANAYRSTYEFASNADYQTDYFYKRNYTFNYADDAVQNTEQALISTNYEKSNSWNYTLYPIQNLIDGNTGTFIHTNFAVTAARPLEFVVDMGEAKTVNRLTLYTQNRGGNGDWLCPRAFTLEGSLDGENFFLVGNFTNDIRTTIMTFNFEEDATFRYYRIVFTLSDRLLIIAEIQMWHIFEINGGTKLSPGNAQLQFSKGWTSVQTQASFGQVYLGQNGDTLKFEFTGSRVAILSSKAFGQNFQVFIDDDYAISVNLKEDDSDFAVVFLSELLDGGKHIVEIKCMGEMNVDSIVTFP